VYAGLAFIFLNYCVVPIAAYLGAGDVPSFPLPQEFWLAWGGIVATWSVGRSMEKRGVRSQIVGTITGSGKSTLLD